MHTFDPIELKDGNNVREQKMVRSTIITPSALHPGSLTEDQHHEIGAGEAEEVVVGGGVHGAVADDDDAGGHVAHDARYEQRHVDRRHRSQNEEWNLKLNCVDMTVIFGYCDMDEKWQVSADNYFKYIPKSSCFKMPQKEIPQFVNILNNI